MYLIIWSFYEDFLHFTENLKKEVFQLITKHLSSVVKQLEVKSLSRVRLFVTLRTIACQAPPSVGFIRQE